MGTNRARRKRQGVPVSLFAPSGFLVNDPRHAHGRAAFMPCSRRSSTPGCARCGLHLDELAAFLRGAIPHLRSIPDQAVEA
jgi:hypothetical protein